MSRSRPTYHPGRATQARVTNILALIAPTFVSGPLGYLLSFGWRKRFGARPAALCPRATAAASLLGSGTAIWSPSSTSPVAISTMRFAHSFKSRGRLGDLFMLRSANAQRALTGPCWPLFQLPFGWRRNAVTARELGLLHRPSSGISTPAMGPAEY